jgi:thiosulfate/3-mercaptopyruvate sulfurtransferase
MLSLSIAAAVLTSVFISPQQAQQLMATGATVLDARDKGYVWGHLPGARPISWLDYRDGWGRTGRLPADLDQLARRLGQLGVASERPVVVYGDAQRGFGEEGRIAWMLSYLGHPQVYMLDGGIAAWRQLGMPLSRGLAPAAARGSDFAAHVQGGLRADKAAVAAALGRPETVILDVRSEQEWHGATPYFEARGGRIPSARHLDWKQLLDDHGRLRRPDELAALLRPLGIGAPDAATAAAPPAVIVYCTGGVRSAFVWAALRSLGVAGARNYDGSFWEWAADRSLPVETDGSPRPADTAKRPHP